MRSVLSQKIAREKENIQLAKTKDINKEQLKKLKTDLEAARTMYLDTISKLNLKKDHENKFLEYIENLANLIDEYRYRKYTSNMKYFINEQISIIRETSSKSKKLHSKNWTQQIEDFYESYPLERKFVKTLPTRQSIQVQLATIEQYRKERHDDLIEIKRSPHAKRYERELDKLVNNLVERAKIIKEQETKFEEIKKQFKSESEVIPIEQLEILREKDFYDFEYYERVKEYNVYVSKLEKHQEEFLNSFLEYKKNMTMHSLFTSGKLMICIFSSLLQLKQHIKKKLPRSKGDYKVNQRKDKQSWMKKKH